MATRDKTLDLFCTILSMKEKKKALYAEAMKACPDQVGVETFKMLFDTEAEHINRIQSLYEAVKRGEVSPDACRFHPLDDTGRRGVLRRMSAEKRKMPKACFDDVAAIDTGLHMEDASITFYTEQREHAVDPFEREFLDRILEEEREHYKVLADLRFYYVDPEHWFMDKAGNNLDGAGAFS